MDTKVLEETLKGWFSSPPRVCVLTGAGVSAESGVPTFRGEDGLWKNYRAEELATPQAFQSNPMLVWEWYDMRRGKMKSAKCNPAHTAIATLQTKRPGTILISQNVDGLHRLAGSEPLLEMHGCIWETRCTQCGDVREDRRHPLTLIPTCESCDGMLRPNVVWFGESLDATLLQACVDASQTCDLFIVAGTSAIVYPAAGFAQVAAENGARVIEINPDMTPLSQLADLTLQGPAGEFLPTMVEILNTQETLATDTA